MGLTYEGREQYLYTLTNYEKAGWENNKVVFYFCGTHPREAIAYTTCPHIMENLLLNEQSESFSDFNVTNGLLNKITFIILPIFNVDGFYHNHKYNSNIDALKEAMDSSTLASEEITEIWQRFYHSKMQRKSMAPNSI
jgi:murein tripeptide amidase MpaA